MINALNGEAKALVQGARTRQQTQETLALLKILALGRQQIAEGRVVPLDDAVARVRSRRRSSE